MDLEGTQKKYRKAHLYWCRPGTFQVDLECTIEKVQEILSLLVQARNLPGGPRRYSEKVQESSPVLVQARDLPGGPRRYCGKSAGKFMWAEERRRRQREREEKIMKKREESKQ